MKNEAGCKGHIYRYRERTYMNSSGCITYKQVVTPLKRRSCKGCVRCGGILEMIKEDPDIPLPVGLRDGNTVKIVSVNDGRNFEDMHDEWHLEFVKI